MWISSYSERSCYCYIDELIRWAILLLLSFFYIYRLAVNKPVVVGCWTPVPGWHLLSSVPVWHQMSYVPGIREVISSLMFLSSRQMSDVYRTSLVATSASLSFRCHHVICCLLCRLDIGCHVLVATCQMCLWHFLSQCAWMSSNFSISIFSTLMSLNGRWTITHYLSYMPSWH